VEKSGQWSFVNQLTGFCSKGTVPTLLQGFTAEAHHHVAQLDTCCVDVAKGSAVSNAGVIGWSAIRETCLSFAFRGTRVSQVCDLFS